MRHREDGVAYAYSKADGNAYALPRGDFPRLKAEWMAGRAFYDGVGCYGSPLVLRLADIVAISDVTPEQMAEGRADRAEDEREDAIDG